MTFRVKPRDTDKRKKILIRQPKTKRYKVSWKRHRQCFCFDKEFKITFYVDVKLNCKVCKKNEKTKRRAKRHKLK